MIGTEAIGQFVSNDVQWAVSIRHLGHDSKQ